MHFLFASLWNDENVHEATNCIKYAERKGANIIELIRNEKYCIIVFMNQFFLELVWFL